MASAIYILNAFILGLCGVLLLRGYWRGRQRLLLWSGICFLLLGVTNFLVLVDLVLTPTSLDLFPLRLSLGVIATSLLVFGLIWESGQEQ